MSFDPIDLETLLYDTRKSPGQNTHSFHFPSINGEAMKPGPNRYRVPLSEWPEKGADQKTLAAFATCLPKGAAELPTSHTVTLEKVPFQIDGPKAVTAVRKGRGRVFFSVEKEADWLYFLFAASGVKGKPFTDIRALTEESLSLIYVDGQKVGVRLRAGYNLTDYADPEPTPSNPLLKRAPRSIVAWQSKSSSEDSVSLLRLDWPNPRPDVEVAYMTLEIPNWARRCELGVLAITAGSNGTTGKR